jgi:hypothetical protein
VLPVLVPEIVLGFSLLRSVAVGQDLPIFSDAADRAHADRAALLRAGGVGQSLAVRLSPSRRRRSVLGSPPLKTFFTIVLPNIREIRRDRGVHPGLHHLDQRCVGVAVPDRAGGFHPADPDAGAYGAVL